MGEYAAGKVDHTSAQQLTDFDGCESERREVARVYCVVIHDHGFAKVDGLEKRISEAFIKARISHQVTMRIKVEQSVELPSVFVRATVLRDALGDEANVDPGILDAFA